MNIDKEKIDHGFYQMPLPEQLEVPNEQKLIIFGKDISSWNRSAQFLFCVCGVFTFYLLYGYYQVTTFLQFFILILEFCKCVLCIYFYLHNNILNCILNHYCFDLTLISNCNYSTKY